jgi:hypothetical protein
MIRVSHVQHGFKVTELLHPFEERIANEGNALTRIQFQRQLRFDRWDDRWTRRCFLEDAKLEETGVFRLLSMTWGLPIGTNS